MSQLILFVLLATTAISCAAANCEPGFFCDYIKGKRETLLSSQERYPHEKVKIYRARLQAKIPQTKNKVMARFLANAYKFLEKENEH